MTRSSLRAWISRAARRLLVIGGGAAVTWGLVAAVLVVVGGVWLDLLWDLSPAARIASVAAAGAAGMVLVAALTWRVAIAAHAAAIARRFDRAAGSGGSILTGLELEATPAGRACPVRFAATSADLGRMAVDQAAALAARVPAARAVPAKPLGQSLASFVALLAGIGLLALLMPKLAATQWRRFTSPLADVPPFSSTEFKVTPGDTKVIYGEELGIQAATSGTPVDQVELVLEDQGGRQTVLPMFPEREGVWQTVLAKVTEPSIYYVRAYRARSERYRIDVITVPRIENARLRIVPPAYAHQAAYEGPMPKDGVAGLPGTTVSIWLGSNRPLRGGTLALSGVKGAKGMKSIPMEPSADDEQEVAGSFTVAGDGKFECRVIDREGQASQQSFCGTVTMLTDQYPFVRILQPQRMSLATPTAHLPVVLSAEDDCGISRLQLFRSLNDSRPLPLDIAVPPAQPRRLDEQVLLPLARYGLEPGDVIKLFARVEDNDPAGTRGPKARWSPCGSFRRRSSSGWSARGEGSRCWCRNTARRGGAWKGWPRRWKDSARS